MSFYLLYCNVYCYVFFRCFCQICCSCEQMQIKSYSININTILLYVIPVSRDVFPCERPICKLIVVGLIHKMDRITTEHETLAHCWVNAGSTSQTLNQYWFHVRPASHWFNVMYLLGLRVPKIGSIYSEKKTNFHLMFLFFLTKTSDFIQ